MIGIVRVVRNPELHHRSLEGGNWGSHSVRLYYDVPIHGMDWSIAEYRVLCRHLFHWTTSGAIEALRSEMEKCLGGRIVLVNSGRAAIELALSEIASHVVARDVLLPAFICQSVPDTIVKCGFRPVLFDVDRRLIPDIDAAIALISKKTAAVLYPYLYGRTIDISRLKEACLVTGVTLIEDCATAFMLADESEQVVGRSGDYSIFSFAVGKTRTAGSGGALRIAADVDSGATESSLRPNDRSAARKIGFVLDYDLKFLGYVLNRLGRAFGRSIPFSAATQIQRMADLDADLLMVQERRWGAIEAGKRRVLSCYAERLAGSPVHLPQWEPGKYLNRLFVQFPFEINPLGDNGGTTSARSFLRTQGIETQLPYLPIQHIARFSGLPTNTALSDWLFQSCIEVPSQAGLTAHQIDKVCSALCRIAESPDRFALKREPSDSTEMSQV